MSEESNTEVLDDVQTEVKRGSFLGQTGKVIAYIFGAVVLSSLTVKVLQGTGFESKGPILIGVVISFVLFKSTYFSKIAKFTAIPLVLVVSLLMVGVASDVPVGKTAETKGVEAVKSDQVDKVTKPDEVKAQFADEFEYLEKVVLDLARNSKQAIFSRNFGICDKVEGVHLSKTSFGVMNFKGRDLPVLAGMATGKCVMNDLGEVKSFSQYITLALDKQFDNAARCAYHYTVANTSAMSYSAFIQETQTDCLAKF